MDSIPQDAMARAMRNTADLMDALEDEDFRRALEVMAEGIATLTIMLRLRGHTPAEAMASATSIATSAVFEAVNFELPV